MFDPAPIPANNVIAFPRADVVMEGYRRLAEANPEFVVRESQVELSRQVREACMTNGVLVAEAPTGTGKTIAYLVGALAAARETGLPVVVSTATVALQEQVIRHDLPRIRATGLVSDRDLAVMKGRGRYFCQRKAERLVQDGKLLQGDLFGEAREVAVPSGARDMLAAFTDGTWRGDIDSWVGANPPGWDEVRADVDTCVGKSCEFYDKCKFFKDRNRARDASLVIANHDLVLADLRLRDEGMEPLLPYDRYAVVFDEAHHLPDKAREAASSQATQKDADALIAGLPEILAGVDSRPWLDAPLLSAGVDSSRLDPGRIKRHLADLFAALALLDLPLGKYVVYGREQPPADLVRLALVAAEETSVIATALSAVGQAVRKASAKQEEGPDTTGMLRLMVIAGKAASAARRLYAGFAGFCSGESLARWVAQDAGGLQLCSGPTEGSEVLPQLLWQRGFPVVMVSATLKTLGSFASFTQRAALPSYATFLEVASVFDYSKSTLTLANMALTPSEAGFEDELVVELSTLIDPKEGTLLLFTSKARMLRVIAKLPPHLSKRVLAQFSMPIKQLVESHKGWLDRGVGSILVGVDTFSEGLDLPGRYCTHVIITQIPFPQLGTPLEETRAGDLGRRYFSESLLPAAAKKLAQSVGRLLRRESDSGRVTLMDARLRRHKYGADLIQGLPDFNVVRIHT